MLTSPYTAFAPTHGIACAWGSASPTWPKAILMVQCRVQCIFVLPRLVTRVSAMIIVVQARSDNVHNKYLYFYSVPSIFSLCRECWAWTRLNSVRAFSFTVSLLSFCLLGLLLIQLWLPVSASHGRCSSKCTDSSESVLVFSLSKIGLHGSPQLGQSTFLHHSS